MGLEGGKERENGMMQLYLNLKKKINAFKRRAELTFLL